jgi:pimeloyl-ACP methyl ester carboxylesterase
MIAAAGARRVRTWQDRIETQIEVVGSGPAVVYLHGPWGLRGDAEFLARLGQHNTVYAPMHPGTTPGDPRAIHELDDVYDLVVYYGELLERLEVGPAPLIGHSYGGMLACEIALVSPARVSQLVVIDPVGLWHDDLPVRNWMILPDAERSATLFARPDGPAARRFLSVPEEPDAKAEALANFIWAQACTGKFVWPIPDRGLKDRIHRIAAPTMIVWGAQDRVVPVAYARDFEQRITNSRVELIQDAGHLPHVEQAESVAGLVRRFLGGADYPGAT